MADDRIAAFKIIWEKADPDIMHELSNVFSSRDIKILDAMSYFAVGLGDMIQQTTKEGSERESIARLYSQFIFCAACGIIGDYEERDNAQQH